MGFLDLVRIPQSRDRYRVGPFRSIPVSSLKGDAKMKTRDLKQPNASISQNDFIEPRRRHDPREARPEGSQFRGTGWIAQLVHRLGLTPGITLVERAAAEGAPAIRCWSSTCRSLTLIAVGIGSSICFRSARTSGTS